MAGLTDTEKRVLALADNKVAQNAGWDREMLALELGDLAELLPPLNWDLSITGFPSIEIDCLMEDHGAAKPGSEDKVPAGPRPSANRCDAACRPLAPRQTSCSLRRRTLLRRR
jgi:hypothetical protein